MAMVIDRDCPLCGGPMILRCGDVIVDGYLDLTIECDDSECTAPVLNAFVAISAFVAIDEVKP